MKISSNSWHWKLNKIFTEYPRSSYSLCTYFWLTVRNICIVSFLTIMALIVTSAVLSPIGYLLGWYGSSEFVYIGLGFDYIILALVVYILLKMYWEETIKPKWFKDSGKTKTKRVNIAFEYVKAKKSKICPILEVE